MVRDKIGQDNVLLSNLQKIGNLICLFEKQAKCSEDPLCRSFLKNAADKKSIQLIVLEHMVGNSENTDVGSIRLAEKQEEPHFSKYFPINKLEEIFNFISRQSLRDLKLYTMMSLENGSCKRIFEAMANLEEDFLAFIETDYIHHLLYAAMADTNINESETARMEVENIAG